MMVQQWTTAAKLLAIGAVCLAGLVYLIKGGSDGRCKLHPAPALIFWPL